MVECKGDRYQCTSQTQAQDACTYHGAQLCTMSQVQRMGGYCSAGYMADGVGWYMPTKETGCGEAGWNSRANGAAANAYCCGAITPEPTPQPTTANPTMDPCAGRMCDMLPCPQGKVPAKENPTDCCDSICLDSESMNEHTSDAWVMGRVADDVYKCKESLCYVNSKQKRAKFVMTTAPEDLSLTPAEFFDEFTSDGQWSVQDGTLTFASAETRNSFPFECACQA
jgi:hypothetical protein